MLSVYKGTSCITSLMCCAEVKARACLPAQAPMANGAYDHAARSAEGGSQDMLLLAVSLDLSLISGMQSLPIRQDHLERPLALHRVQRMAHGVGDNSSAGRLRDRAPADLYGKDGHLCAASPAWQ